MPGVVASTLHHLVRQAQAEGVCLPEVSSTPDATGRVPAAGVLALLQAAVSVTDPGFPLRAARITRRDSMGLVHLFADAAPTLGAAQRRFVDFAVLVTDLYQWRADEAADRSRLVCEGVPDDPAVQWLLAFDLADTVAFTQAALGPAADIRLVLERPGVVPFGDLGVRVDNGAWTGVSVPRLALETPLLHANAAVSDLLEQRLRDLHLHIDPPVWSAVIQDLREHLSCAPSIHETAGRLGMSRRTLARRLQQEGRSFRDLLSGLRRREAMRLLSDHSVESVAHSLGYSEARPFNRAFRRWTGLSPSHWRDRQAAQEGLDD